MNTTRRTCVSWTITVALGLLALSNVASAKVFQLVSYPMTDVWPSAVRFLRVDKGFPIREKDDSAGYILFDYLDGQKTCKASLELVRVTDAEGRDATRIFLVIPDLPRHYEQMFLDKFSAKLREDHGAPVPRKQETPRDAAAAGLP